MEKTASKTKQLITVANYATKYGVTRQTVYNWIRENKIQSTEIDGVRFVYK